MANILSLHFGIHDSAAALFDDYRIVAAIQKERLNREKKSGGPPIDCIREVLAKGAYPPKADSNHRTTECPLIAKSRPEDAG